MTHCPERASGQLLALCQPTATDEPAAVLVRTGATATIQAATLAELRAAAGLLFRGATRNGTLQPFSVTFNANGTATVDEDGVQIISAVDVDALFSAGGWNQPDAQAGLKGYKDTPGGVTKFYLVNYGVPLAGSFSNHEPALLVQP